MKKWLPLIIIVVLLLLIGRWFMNVNNNLVPLDESANAQWANVESTYQRRADLIPNIVNTAKGYAEFEQETLTKVVEARSKATGITIDPSNITPEKLAQFQQAQSGLSSALSRLMVVFERYPELKANENFKELINELTRTETRINVERIRFNEKVEIYNSKIKRFPTKLIAGLLDFDPKAYFKAEEGSEKAPKVEF